ncbi:hypothetical protein [Dyella acidisoli]|uniref:Uncharacterized protein n=1 Tax=Dyella acidisoli TaxID=1867834 RepID=A0ABQ5XHL7_9GAMM|nr:hypothetical protein [Dyella acidisoli]GLQ91143.1 hypothetical protein GCM10007901_00930 [Dyella acidisoli]
MIKRLPLILVALLLTCQVHASIPKGWIVAGTAREAYDVGTQAGDRHPGDRNAFLRAKSSSNGFGTLMQSISADAYIGKRVRLSGFLRTQDVISAAMWMRIDGSTGVVGFDNMDSRPLRGTLDWQRYEIVLDVPANANAIAFGFLLEGNKGQVLADDFKLEVVGKEVPLTGIGRPVFPSAPINLNFEQ